ncbi:MAG: cache domain-containing protein [Lachnospiraceae bacterium]|nr:cache domain-containing protein [Lachnospiraceae bacterium]
MTKKRNRKLISKVIYIALSALILVVTILTIIGAVQINKAYYTGYESELKNATIQLKSEVCHLEDGADWDNSSYEVIKKGGADVTGEIQEIIDTLHKDTGVDFTIFMGDTRAVTSLIKKGTNERIVGTKASDVVIAQCLTGGNDYFGKNLTINEEKYVVYYIPLRNSDDSIVGMVFAGIPSKSASHAVINSILLMIISSIVITGLIYAAGMYVANKTSGKMNKLADQLIELANGNLNITVDPTLITRMDELGSISESTQILKDKLNETMNQITDMVGNLNSSSDELSTSSDQASEASSQVTTAIDEISKGAVSQAESIETATTDTANIGDNIDEITKRVKELDTAATGMKKSCDNAMHAMTNLITQNTNVTESVKEIGQTIESTNQSAKSIDTFSQAITDIATQTNLLSLNASIEAARAGEAGRGFAVVADEIRALADQSKESADKIKDIVGQLLADSDASVAVMQKLNENFSEQSTQLDATKQDMHDMMENVNNVSESSELISIRVAELDKAKESLLSIISDLSAISEENAASTEETNASMEELNATFNILNTDASQLKELAEKLSDTISFFKF